MAPSSDRHPVDLPAGWGVAWLDRALRGSGPAGSVRSYSHTGLRLVWLPPAGVGRCAADLECVQRMTPATCRVLGLPQDASEAAQLWLAAELEAKLLDLPILHLWHTQRTKLSPLAAAESTGPLSGARRYGLLVPAAAGDSPHWMGLAFLADCNA